MDTDGSFLSSSNINPDIMEHNQIAMAWSVFNELRMEGQFCDAIIKVDEVEFNIHKNILSGCSPYFRALFTRRWHKKEKTSYTIPGTTPDVMALLIEYAYTRRVTITTTNVERLLIAADQFMFLGVVRHCTDFLIGQLSLENCIGICRFSSRYYCPELQKKVNMYILHHFQDVVTTSEFLDLSLTELLDIIEKDELNVKEEEVIFEAIVKWIDHNPTNRKQHIAILLTKIRMGLMNCDYFICTVKTNAYVKDNEECTPIVIDVLQTMYDLKMKSPSDPFLNPLIRPRLPFEILLAVGGWSGGNPTNAIEAYDYRANRWVNITCNKENPRAYHGTAYLNGYVYLMGGFDGVEYFNSVRRFDPVSKIWQEVSSMNSKRCYVSVAVLNNFIYALGGFDGYIRMNSAERYNPETNQWTVTAHMQEQRSDAKATTLNGKIYICGGFNGTECLSTAEVYCPVTNRWSMIAPMRCPRSGVGVMAFEGQVYAVGGFDGSDRLCSAEKYDPASNTWQAICPMSDPRSNFGIEVLNDFLYVVGGFNGFTTTFNAERYDKKTKKWYDVQDMNIFRSALSCCIVSGLPNIREYTARQDSINKEVRESLFSRPQSV